LVYCANCGEKVPDEANFCPKCGTKTPKGKGANVLYPTNQLTDAFYNVGLELEKAFNMAARETHSAIQRARGNLAAPPRNTQTQTVVCPKCGSKNLCGAIFCNNCGSRIAPVDESPSGDA